MLYRRKYKTTLIFTRTYSRSLSYSSGSHIQLDQACRRQKCLYHSHLWIPADKSSNWGRWKRVRFRKSCQWLLSNRTGVEKYQRTLQQAPRVLWDSIEKRSRNDYPFQISCIIFYQYFLNKSHHKTDQPREKITSQGTCIRSRIKESVLQLPYVVTRILCSS